MPRTTSSDQPPTPATDVHPGRRSPGRGEAAPPAPADQPSAAAEPATQAPSTGRWWAAVGVGVIVAMPFAWLLSYAAALPYFLGLFFFALFGLLIGAAMHRLASPRRPYAVTTLVVGTTIVVATGWAVSIVTEGSGFAADMAVKAGQSTRKTIPDIEAYRAKVADQVDRFLREQYPPGGSLGYVRWILTSGELKKGQIAGVHRTLRRTPRRGWWAVRVALSLGLLAFGIASQTLPLRLTTEHAVRVIDEAKAAD